MYSKDQFLEHFRREDPATLLDRLVREQLTDDARSAARQVLVERGVDVSGIVDITDDDVLAHAQVIRSGPCPVCKQQRSPVDFREEHWVWSAVVLTRYGRNTRLCCRDCGKAHNLRALGKSALLGWWGFPFGLLITPYKIGINLYDYLRKDHEPSLALQNWVRKRLREQMRPPVY